MSSRSRRLRVLACDHRRNCFRSMSRGAPLFLKRQLIVLVDPLNYKGSRCLACRN
jgi:hypothetical protein